MRRVVQVFNTYSQMVLFTGSGHFFEELPCLIRQAKRQLHSDNANVMETMFWYLENSIAVAPTGTGGALVHPVSGNSKLNCTKNHVSSKFCPCPDSSNLFLM